MECDAVQMDTWIPKFMVQTHSGEREREREREREYGSHSSTYQIPRRQIQKDNHRT